LLVDIVRNDKPVGSVCGALASNVAKEEVLRVLDQVRRVHQVVLRIQVVVDDVVAEGLHVSFAAGRGVAVGERRPHVGGEEAQDVVERDLVVVHLFEALSPGQFVHGLGRGVGAEILVGPGMRRDLMASGVHALDDRRIASVDISDLSCRLLE
jgi:hypothetical protein